MKQDKNAHAIQPKDNDKFNKAYYIDITFIINACQ